jgi:hypothetical protein
MGTITINPTVNQSNKPWTLTWKASGRYPIVADRIYSTLAQAQAYVDDKSATASAIPGLVISVVDDPIAKNNGVYYIESIANSKADTGFPIADKGVLVKVGGTETETATNYSAAVTLSQTLVTGQLIKVTNTETVNGNTFKAGFYIVETPGTISALDTSTGAADEVGAIKARVDALEANRVLVSDFDTYKAEVTGALNAKAGLDAFNTHNNNANIHVTSEDKAKWNLAEENAITAAGLAADTKVSTMANTLRGEIATAVSDANGYTDTKIGNYTNGDTAATGVRKEIEDRLKALREDAKTYSIVPATTDELGTLGGNIKEAYKLVDEDGTKCGDYIKIYNDSSLESVRLDGQSLIFSYILVDGSKTDVPVDLSAFLADTEFGNGLKVNNGTVSVKVDSASESFLTVGTEGVKLSGVQDAINSAKTEINGSIEAISKTVTDNKTACDKALADAKTEINNTISAINKAIADNKAACDKALTDAITAEVTRSNKYVDDKFNSIQFVETTDIDTIFAPVAE